MLTNMFKVMALIFPIFISAQAFWWRTSPTEAPPSTPPPLVMKQIPLTYFRTYTYQQPLTSNAVPLPFLSSTDYISNYNNPFFNPMMSALPMSLSTSNEIPLDARPSKRYGISNFNMVRSLGNVNAETITTSKPSTTTPATTTTTTPEPTTTTTTTTEPPTTWPVEASSTNMPILTSETTFPAFNRKAFTNHFNINYNRPVYPYPDYSVNEKNSASANIEFVPCMCPVSISNAGFAARFQTGLSAASNPSNSLLLAQGRTNVDVEASLDVPVAKVVLNAPAKAVEENSNLTQDLEVVKLNEDAVAAISSQTL